MLRLCRVTAKPRKANNTATKFTFDVILDESGALADEDRPIFGMQGDVEGLKPHRIPFVIDSHGIIDYGGAYDDPCLKDFRRDQSNLREMQFIRGRVFTLTSPDGTPQTFEITDCNQLLAG
jgi:hypothetical protein